MILSAQGKCKVIKHSLSTTNHEKTLLIAGADIAVCE
jgi:hypothetical protein